METHEKNYEESDEEYVYKNITTNKYLPTVKCCYIVGRW